MLLFDKRMKLAKLILDWCEEENIQKCFLNCISYLQAKGYLNEEKILADLEQLNEDNKTP